MECDLESLCGNHGLNGDGNTSSNNTTSMYNGMGSPPVNQLHHPHQVHYQQPLMHHQQQMHGVQQIHTGPTGNCYMYTPRNENAANSGYPENNDRIINSNLSGNR